MKIDVQEDECGDDLFRQSVQGANSTSRTKRSFRITDKLLFCLFFNQLLYLF